jgi:murein DD-endopeptidase MepM/ murein hydrolase activator NlpD
MTRTRRQVLGLLGIALGPVASLAAQQVAADSTPAGSFDFAPPGPVGPGDVILLRARLSPSVDAVVGVVFGREIRFYPGAEASTWQGLLGVDVDVTPGRHALALSGSRLGSIVASGRYDLDVVPRRFSTRRLRVASRFVDPSPAEQERSGREAARLAALFTQVTPRQWDGPFRTPLPAPPTSNFGIRSVFNGQPRNPHAGVDFTRPTGTPVSAPNAGTVALAEELYFTGNTVILDHGLGLFSLYAHLSRIDVTDDRAVTLGQTLGLLGATGRVTGPHLHWAIRVNGARVDPLSLVAALAQEPVR